MEDGERFFSKKKKQYNRILVHDILPYWLGKTDSSGGFYTCYNVYGDRLESKDKYVWSQGRCVWLYSKLAENKNVVMEESIRMQCRELAVRGSQFLEEFCLLADGRAAFVLDGENRAKAVSPYGSKAVSTFADCFVAMGLAAAGSLMGEQKKVEKAFRFMMQAAQQMKDGTFRTAPDVLPDGWRSQAVYMIMVNTAYEVGMGLKVFGMTEEEASAREICRYAMGVVTDSFLTEEDILLECLDHQFRPLNTLYGRHINPGHTEECMWFLIQAARWLEVPKVEHRALKVIKHVAAMAWDETYGGMFYYLDRDGGQPEGTYLEDEKPLADGALRDWDSKMWWPHLETMYAALMGYVYYGDETCLKEYKRYDEYTVRVFPNPNKEVGEWIQIRNRQGHPASQEVGGRLPVKDPYHLIRTLMLLQDIIEKIAVKGSDML